MRNIEMCERQTVAEITQSHADVAVVHIGARSGYVPFCFPKYFDSAIEFIMIDAAEDAVIPSVWLSDGREFGGLITPLHAVISAEVGKATFQKTSCPFAAGLKPFNNDFAEWYSFGNGNCDYVLGEAHKLCGADVVDCVTIDSLFEIGVLPKKPAILSIDAQGLSFEILTGASQFVKQYVHVIVCEVELINFYIGTPSFSLVLKTLAEWGYNFYGFLPSSTTWASPVRRPVGQRGRTHRGSEDAVFIRDIRKIPDHSLDSQIAFSLFCHVFGSVEAGVDVAEKVKDFEPVGPIQKFVCEVKSVLHHQQRYPRTFEEKERDLTVPSRRFEFSWSRFLLRLRLIGSSGYPTFGWSQYEKLLKKWDFHEIAQIIRGIRKQQICHSSNSVKPKI
jgi:FkbM family methyltransferase